MAAAVGSGGARLVAGGALDRRICAVRSKLPGLLAFGLTLAVVPFVEGRSTAAA